MGCPIPAAPRTSAAHRTTARCAAATPPVPTGAGCSAATAASWRTHNGAANWAQASAALCGRGSVSAIAVAPTNSNRVAMGMSDGCINLTTVGLSADSGTVWAVTQPPGTDSAYNSGLTYDPRDE